MWGPGTEDVGPQDRSGGGGQREHHVARMLRLPGFIWLIMKGSKPVRECERNRSIER